MKVHSAVASDPSSPKRPVTMREELSIVCKKIADLDAIWRTKRFQESPAEKRAA